MGRKLYKVLLGAIFALIISSFSAKTYALDISQQDLIVSAHSPTLTIHHNGITTNDFQITPQLEFNKIGDFITYKLTLRNNDGKKYKIVEVKDDNTNDAVELTYVYSTSLDTADKSLELTIKYAKKSTTPLQTVTVTIGLVDEDDASQQIPIVVPGDDDEGGDEMVVPNADGETSGGSSASGSGSVTPNTGANTSEGPSAVIRNTIIIYGAFAVAVIAVYFVVRHKKKAERNFIRRAKTITAIILALALIPAIVIAATSKNLQFVIEFNSIQFNGPYTITFDSNGGTPVPTQTVDHNTFAAKPGDPQKPGYTFAKWLDETNTEFNFTTTKVTKDYNLTATYTLDNYTINYDLAGGTAGTPANPTSYTYEGNDITLTNPTKDGHDFLGWTGEGITTPTPTITIPKHSTGDKSYTANWKIKTYTVTYTTDGGTPVPPTETKNYQEKFTEPTTNPTKTGYDFDGWLDQNDQSYDFTTEATADITLKAKWNLKTYAINYTLPTGATNHTSNPATYTYETNDITLEAPTKDHYDFTGWTTPIDDTPKLSVTIPKNSTGDKTFTANFTPHKYIITYDLDGGSETTNPTEYTIKTPDFTLAEPTPPSTDKAFAGWLDISDPGNPSTTPVKTITITEGTTGNKSYKATYKNFYTVTFDVGASNDTPPQDRIILDGDKIGALPAGPKPIEFVIYEFDGWYVGETEIDENYEVPSDITVVAKYKRKTVSNGIEDIVEEDVTDESCVTNADDHFGLVVSDDPDGNARYIGKCPSNYVYFNCESDPTGVDNYDYASSCDLYRIVGVFKVDDGTGKIEKRVKIIKDVGLKATDGVVAGPAWDTNSRLAADHVPGRHGVNQWGETTYKDYYNGQTYQYSGAYLKTILNRDFYNKDLIPASNKVGVNARWYYGPDWEYSFVYDSKQSLSEYSRSLIGDAVWHTGAVNSDNAYTPAQFYTLERGNAVPAVGNDINSGVAMTTKWTGKIALLYPSDYMFAPSDSSKIARSVCIGKRYTEIDSKCHANSWLLPTGTQTEYMITPDAKVRTSLYTASAYGVKIWGIVTNYSFDANHYSNNAQVRPAMYLKSDVKFLSGTGEKTNPFKIGLIPDNVTTHFDTGGGTQIPPQTTNYEGKATRPATDPEKEGYTFKKWVDKNGDDYDFNTPVIADQTITAVYEAKPYTVTFKPGDEATMNDSDKTRIVLYDDPIGDLPTPAVSHPLKEFSHWEVNGQPIDKDYIVKGDTEAEAVLKGKKTTNVIDDLVDEDTTDTANTTCYASDTAGRSLVLSDDPDNNPRYVGKCPKNYVYFNCKTDPTGIDNYDYAGSCEKWRIIGVFDVDDGTGKIEKRVKIMRADPLTDNTGKTTYFAYDTTQFSIKITNYYTASFVGFTQWGPTTYKNGDTYPGALLMRELNGDYLNYNLTSDPAWPTFTYAHYDKNYDRRQSLSAYAQTLIGDAVWHTGAIKGRYGLSDRHYDTNGVGSYALPGVIPKTAYEMERGDLVPDFGTSKENSDNHDPLNRTTKWTGKVGLIYYSDIPYATNGYLNQSYQRKYCLNNSWDIEINVSAACSTYDWLVKGSSSNKILTMTPAYYTRRDSPPWSDVIFFGADGLYDVAQTYGGSGPIHPVVFLNADVRTSTGTGALNDPFTLE